MIKGSSIPPDMVQNSILVKQSTSMKPNLVLIEGTKATRYVNGKVNQVVNIDYSVGIRNVMQDIEYFRQNGVEIGDESA